MSHDFQFFLLLDTWKRGKSTFEFSRQFLPFCPQPISWSTPSMSGLCYLEERRLRATHKEKFMQASGSSRDMDDQVPHSLSSVRASQSTSLSLPSSRPKRKTSEMTDSSSSLGHRPRTNSPSRTNKDSTSSSFQQLVPDYGNVVFCGRFFLNASICANPCSSIFLQIEFKRLLKWF